DGDDQVARWAASPGLFAADLADAASVVGDRFVLVIDQLEELETLTDADALDSTAAALSVLITDDSAFRIVLAVRADYVARLGERIGVLGHVYTLSSPSRDEIVAIVEQTVAGAGAQLAEGVAAAIADDVAPEPGALGLVQ